QQLRPQDAAPQRKADAFGKRATARRARREAFRARGRLQAAAGNLRRSVRVGLLAHGVWQREGEGRQNEQRKTYRRGRRISSAATLSSTAAYLNRRHTSSWASTTSAQIPNGNPSQQTLQGNSA